MLINHNKKSGLSKLAVIAFFAMSVVSCGDSDGDSIPSTSVVTGGGNVTAVANAGGVTRMITFGDSLSDVGTYGTVAVEKKGGRFTVNGNGGKVWQEYIAADYGLPVAPNVVIAGGGAVLENGGFSYAQGGSRVDAVTQSTSGLGKYAAITNGASIGVMVSACPTGTLGTVCFLHTETIGTGNAGAMGAGAKGYVLLTPEAAGANAGSGYFVDTNGDGVPNRFTVNGQTGLVRSGLTTLPVSQQVKKFLETDKQTFKSSDLVVMLAGANDLFAIAAIAAALPPASVQSEVGALLTDAVTRYVTIIKADVLGKGAQKVVVALLPDMGKTPLALARGPATQALFSSMSTNFNLALKAQLANNSNVLLVDTQALFNEVLANPAANGLTNVTGTACKLDGTMKSNPETAPEKVTTSSLFCNTTDLVAANADKTYAFADSVHPTPALSEILAKKVLVDLKAKGWR